MEAIRAGNFAFQTLEESRKEREWLKWYCAINDYLLNPTNLWKLCYNFSALRLVYGPYELERTEPAVHLGATLELLCKVHGNEIFEHGAFYLFHHPFSPHLLFVYNGFTISFNSGSFNGDPHPGNILLLKDGRLGLIDYGQVKTMTLSERVIYAKLIVALARDDREQVLNDLAARRGPLYAEVADLAFDTGRSTGAEPAERLGRQLDAAWQRDGATA